MIYVFLADGFEEIEALTPIDILRRCGLEVETVSIGGEYVTGARKITVKADTVIDKISDAQMYILPGGLPGADNLEACEKLCGICAAPKILVKLGILKGKKATCYPGYENDLIGAEYTKSPVVSDGNVITANGMGSSAAFALELAGKLCDKADGVAKGILYNG